MIFLISAGAGMIAGAAINAASSAAQMGMAYRNMRLQMRHQKEMYQHRHQWAVKDLRSAGLNPILAVGSGAGSAPGQGGVPTTSAPDLAGAMRTGAEATAVEPGKKLTQAQTSSEKVRKAMFREQGGLYRAQQGKENALAENAWAEAALNDQRALSEMTNRDKMRVETEYMRNQLPKSAIERDVYGHELGPLIWGVERAAPILGGMGIYSGLKHMNRQNRLNLKRHRERRTNQQNRVTRERGRPYTGRGGVPWDGVNMRR